MEYLFGWGTFAISDTNSLAIEFPRAFTRVGFEREFIETQTLDGKQHIEDRKFRGYIETTLWNTEEGEGVKLAQLASLLSNSSSLRIYPQYVAAQASNLLMDCHMSGDWTPEHISKCKVGQSITLQFREYEQRLSLPTTLHYPAGETFEILTGEDGTSTLLHDAGDNHMITQG